MDVPPVTAGRDPQFPVSKLAIRSARHYGSNPRGRTVLKAFNGTYTTVDNPTITQMAAAAIAYQGGHTYTVDTTEAAALTAAGYTVTASASGGPLAPATSLAPSTSLAPQG